MKKWENIDYHKSDSLYQKIYSAFIMKKMNKFENKVSIPY